MDMNTCDIWGCEEPSEDLVWIDAEDFQPRPDDNFDPEKAKNLIRRGVAALCTDCYENACCTEIVSRE